MANQPLYMIMQSAVSEEKLRELKIRISSRESIGEEGSEVACFGIRKAGLDKLGQARYDVSRQVEISEGVMFVALANRDGSPATSEVNPAGIFLVEIDTWDGAEQMRSVITDLAREHLVPAFKRDVNILVPHGVISSTDYSEDTLYVKIWSSDNISEDNQVVPSVMWGLRNSCTDVRRVGIYLAGEPIITEEGDEVAAFSDNVLYVYFDAVHCYDEDQKAILEKIFTECARLKAYGSVHDVERVKERYIKACSARAAVHERAARKEVETCTAKIYSLKKDLTDQIRKLTEAESVVNNMESYKAELLGTLDKEFDHLVKLHKVDSVNWRGNLLTVYTDTIYCTDPRSGHEHEIGRFKLIFDADNSVVWFNNLDRRVHGYQENMHAPHVFSNARACLGTADAYIPQLVAKYEWAQLVQMCVAFLESVNVVDPAGKHINKWPIHRKKEDIEAEHNREEVFAASAEAIEVAAAIAVEEGE